MPRKRWQRPQPLNLSYATEQSYDIYDDENEPSTPPKVPCFSPPPNLVMVSENLNLAPFSKRAVVDFGDFLTVGLPSTRYLRLRNLQTSSIIVHCKRYPTSDEFTLSWLLTTKENAENLPDPETQALIDTSASPISLISSQTIHLGPHGDCLLRVIWTPKPGPLPSVLGAKASGATKLRHVLQFRFSGAAVVEAILVATSVKQPTRGGKKVWKRPHNFLCHRNGSQEYSSTRSVFRSYQNSNQVSAERGTFPLPLSTLNMELNGNVIERGKRVPVSHCSTSAQSVEATLRPSRPSEVSLAAGKRRLMRSSSGLRALAAFMTSRDRHRSQSLDMRDAVSVLAAEDFRTPRRSISTANDLQRTPENEATSFISPALLSPVVKRDTSIIFATGACRSGTSSTAVTSTTSINSSSANIFGWDASAALSAANETGFTRWLNHLFASGQITRSSVSDGDPASRAEGPRAALLRLLHSPTFAAPAHRIEREIDGQRLVVNRDLNFRDDKGLQRCICDLFTSHYASVWLSPCVDVLTELVQSPEAPMVTAAKASALSRRVHRCLFADVPPLPKKKGTKKKANSAGEHEADPMLLANWKSVGATSYTEHYNQQIVKRCLTLIWLLDQAKMKRVLRLDPCLFNVSAPVKSSVEVCQSLGRIYLSRETNLARSLAILGANLSVVQKPLDEFDFTVTNLAVDLRDGLRLVKLADLLLPDARTIFPAHSGSLMSLVRFPAISRLQKIHNVQLALSAFETVAGRRGLCTAAGKPITERDIVNGHRAKTLSLLWFILLRFQVTALLDPPALRSEISLLTATNVSLRRDVEALLMANPSLSACGDEGNNPLVEMECNQRILFVWARAVCFSGGYDEDVKVENLDQSFSDGRVFCYILHFYLPTLLPRGLVRGATTQTAHLYPDIPHPLLLRNNVANLRLFQQRLWHLGDVPMLLNVGPNLPTTANTITPNFTTADVNHHSPSALLPPGIVLTTLAYLASRLICGKGGGSSRLRRIVENHAARIIQTRWRQNRATQGSQFRPKSVVSLPTIHSLCSSPSTNTSMEMEVGETVAANASEKDEVVVSTPATVFTEMGVIEAAVRIQRAVRAWLEARRRCRQKQCFVVEVQAQARAFLARQRVLACQQQALETQVDAAVVIQSAWRAYAARRRFIDLRSSVIRLQAFCRGVLARRAFQTTLATRSAAAVVIQRWWRCRQQRRQFLLQRQVVCLIQRRWRSTLAYRTRLRLAVQLQAAARAYLVRRDVAIKMHAILTLQRHMRRWRSLCRERTTAACIIQRWWWAVKQRRAFLRTLHAVRRIQHWWRGRLLERQREVAAAIAIQRAWRWSRVRHQRRVEERLRRIHIMQMHATAATTIQRAWRRFEVRRQRQRLANAAAGTIQRAWRTYRQKKQSVVEEERAAYVIQRNWRASRLQRWLHRRRWAAIVIQSAWRGYRVRCSGGSTAATVRRRLSEATQEARTRPHNTLGARARCALANLLRYTSVASVLDALGHLETSTRLSREVCLWLLTTPTSTTPATVTSQCGDCGGCDENAEYLPHILLRLLHLCNRSVPDEEVALAAVAVMLNLTVAVDSSDVGTLEMWWQRRVLDEGGSSQSESIVEFLFGSLHRLSRAKPGTSSLRLFARIAALLAILCEALPPDFVLPADYVGEVETLLSLVQRLWSNALSRLPVRAEVRLLLRRHQAHESRRDLLLRLVTLELNLERLPSKPQVNPLTACEFLLLTLREHQRRHKHYHQLKQKHEG